MRSGPRADERALGHATLEHDRRRYRQHVVARCRQRILVDVELRELNPPAALLLELFENRLDGAARSAPTRPEGEHPPCVALQPVALERGVRDLEHELRVAA